MQVSIPSSLLSYTNAPQVEASGASLTDLLADLDRRYPGLRFRVIDEQGKRRKYMRFFVNGEQVFGLALALHQTDEVYPIPALSGG